MEYTSETWHQRARLVGKPFRQEILPNRPETEDQYGIRDMADAIVHDEEPACYGATCYFYSGLTDYMGTTRLYASLVRV